MTYTSSAILSLLLYYPVILYYRIPPRGRIYSLNEANALKWPKGDPSLHHIIFPALTFISSSYQIFNTPSRHLPSLISSSLPHVIFPPSYHLPSHISSLFPTHIIPPTPPHVISLIRTPSPHPLPSTSSSLPPPFSLTHDPVQSLLFALLTFYDMKSYYIT
jgi:hypothetical protein